MKIDYNFITLVALGSFNPAIVSPNFLNTVCELNLGEPDDQSPPDIPVIRHLKFQNLKFTVEMNRLQIMETGIDWTDLALEELEKVYEECSEANWDGYGAMPISRETYSEARKLLRMMPSSLPRSDISAEPDGEITFEWYKEKYSVVVISVGGNNLITYAGLFGKSNKIHGTEYFTDELPEIIRYCIRRLFP